MLSFSDPSPLDLIDFQDRGQRSREGQVGDGVESQGDLSAR